MGMDAYLLGIGPYKEELVRFLDYPADFYDGTADGALVTATLFTCNTSGQSSELATALGIQPWDFNKHRIRSLDQVNWEALYELEEHSVEWDLEHIDGLKALFENGFTLLFMPNG